jgi:hypothetical protein
MPVHDRDCTLFFDRMLVAAQLVVYNVSLDGCRMLCLQASLAYDVGRDAIQYVSVHRIDRVLVAADVAMSEASPCTCP